MRFVTACVAALSATNLATAGSSWFSSTDASASDAEKIPGNSPLELCDSDHSEDTVHIESVDLSPNPPEAYVFCPLPFPALVPWSMSMPFGR